MSRETTLIILSSGHQFEVTGSPDAVEGQVFSSSDPRKSELARLAQPSGAEVRVHPDHVIFVGAPNAHVGRA